MDQQPQLAWFWRKRPCPVLGHFPKSPGILETKRPLYVKHELEHVYLLNKRRQIEKGVLLMTREPKDHHAIPAAQTVPRTPPTAPRRHRKISLSSRW